MFVSRDSNANTKKYQKPNILRKKPKKVPLIKCLPEIPLNTKVVNTTVCGTLDLQGATLTCSNKFVKPTEKPSKDVAWCSDVPNVVENNHMTSRRNLLIDCEEENGSPGSVNVELFLNDINSLQNITQFEIDSDIGCNIKHDWNLDFYSSTEGIIQNINQIESGKNQDVQLPKNAQPTNVVSTTEQTATPTSWSVPDNRSVQYLTGSKINFQCDVADCNKKFRSEQNLNKHKQTHKLGATEKAVKSAMSECPVKKFKENGDPDPCGRKFNTREELAKHLNEDHTLEDANYKCGECGRRFFWSMGVRAHARALCGGRVLQCAWPGCPRQFRQACRLREHQRAHTGDKPYPCRYPECGMSFRTASKLVRHSLGHTGERRHSCAACGRAFLRAEHLRDHLARHKLSMPHTCSHTGCRRTFTHLDNLFKHIRKVHKEEPGNIPEASTLPSTTVEETYTVSLSTPAVTPIEIRPSELDTNVELDTDMNIIINPNDAINTNHAINPIDSINPVDNINPVVTINPNASINPCVINEDTAIISEVALDLDEWHSARTHCTWPLSAKGEPERAFNEPVNQYVLEEDVQVEMSENSESNIYTIRSDLFLHGNILNNEDSEQMSVGVIQPGRPASPAIDAGLSLLDSHTIDLMQEELLYTDDTAVDESSFRVYLLSGEEIQIL